jgi:hypothetical protein
MPGETQEQWKARLQQRQAQRANTVPPTMPAGQNKKLREQLFPTYYKGKEKAKDAGRYVAEKYTKAADIVKNPGTYARQAWDATREGAKKAATYDVTPALKTGAKGIGKGIVGTGRLGWKGLKSTGRGLAAVGGAVGGWAAGRFSSGRGSGFTRDLSESSGWLWFWLAVCLYISDFFTKFNGINYNTLFNTFLSFNFQTWKGIILNGAVLIGLVIYIAVKRPSGREALSFYMLMIVSWLFISMTGWSLGPILHVCFAIAFLFGRLYDWFGDETQANGVAIMFILFDFVLYSVISQYAPYLLFSRISWPIWVLFSLFFVRPSKIKTVMIVLVVIFYILATVDVVAEVRQLSTSPLTQKEIGAGKKMLLRVWENVKSAFDKIKNSEGQYMAQIRGEYYTGEIDQNAKERLGVYLEDLKAADTSFYQNQPVTIWGTLVAKTIKEPITIIIGCIETKDRKDLDMIDVDKNPKEPFTIYSSENDGVECIFKNGSLSIGDHNIGLKADFNFFTTSYIKTYFMNPEAKRALVSEGIDPLDRYGITDKKPNAIYTAGPINVGMDVGNALPLLTDREIRLGITLTNSWEGKLKEIKDVYIITPKSISMIGSSDNKYYCSGRRNYIFEKVSCKDVNEETAGCDDSRLHNVFKFSAQNEKIKDINNYETMLCRFKIDDASGLMGDVPVSTRYFKVGLKYDYSIKKDVNVEIKAGDGIMTTLTECSEKCNDDDRCYCPAGCKKDNTGKDENCGGFKGDGNRKQLSDCSISAVCDDQDGCVCVGSGCLRTGQNIGLNDNCGGTINQENGNSPTLTCDTSTWKNMCQECIDYGLDSDGNYIKQGIFCSNNKWVCTTLSNSGDPSFKPINWCSS